MALSRALASAFLLALTAGSFPALAEVGQSMKVDPVVNPEANPQKEKGRLVRGYRKDEELAREIREALVEDDSLSFAAKNVGIHAKDGRVVLKGTVSSPAEKRKIASIAREWAGPRAVKDEIQIK